MLWSEYGSGGRGIALANFISHIQNPNLIFEFLGIFVGNMKESFTVTFLHYLCVSGADL